MFDIGFSELFVIAIVALIVLGPERLPRAARFAGLWMRRARAQWYSVKSELENELASEELRRSLRQTQDELREAHAELQRSGSEVRQELQSLSDAVNRSEAAAPAVAAPASEAEPGIIAPASGAAAPAVHGSAPDAPEHDTPPSRHPPAAPDER